MKNGIACLRLFGGLGLLLAPAAAQTYSFTTLAGSAEQTGSADGQGAVARFAARDITLDATGNLYVADGNNRTIRRVTPAGVVTTMAGVAGQRGYVDGPVAAARFLDPSGIAIDPAGNLYVIDEHRIRKIASDGVVSTLAGGSEGGYVDATGAAARFSYDYGLAVDAGGNVYVAEYYNAVIRRITPAGVVTTFVGRADIATALIGSDPRPFRLAFDRTGNLFVADNGSYTVRKISPVGVDSVFAGTPRGYGSTDGIGAAAAFAQPLGVAVDESGSVFVTDSSNTMIRRISPDATVSTIAGQVNFPSVVDGNGGNARFVSPSAIAVDSAGNLYVLDGSRVIRKGVPVAAPAPPILHSPPTRSPMPRNVGARTSLTLSGTASGAPPLSYQWMFNGTPLAGATNATLTLASMLAAEAGDYALRVGNNAGTFTSHSITVGVYTPTLGEFTSRRAVPGGNFLWGIASGGGQLVGVGTGGTILSSLDGVTWTRRASGTTDWLVGVTFGAGRFVAVGERGVILVSSDGASWTRATASGTTERLNNVVFGNGRYVAVGERGVALSSTDAQTWTVRATGVTTWLRGLVYEPLVTMPPNWFGSNGTGLFYASGEGGVILSSVEGATWGNAQSPSPYFGFPSTKDLEALAGGPIGIGQDGVIFSTYLYQLASKSPFYSNGLPLPWLTTTMAWRSSLLGISARFRGLARGAGAVFAIGENGIVAGAPNVAGPWGLVPTNTTATLVNGVFHNNSLFVVGENETILQSQPLYSSRLINISTRGAVGAGASTMISGFVVSGTTPKRVLLRAAGPGLAAFGLSGTLAAPVLTLFDGAGRSMATNSGWSTNANAAAIAETAGQVGAFPFTSGSADSALLVTLAPGAYTAQVAGQGGGAGLGLVEAYDAESLASEGSRAVNVSTRGMVGAGANQLIAGFVINGASSRRVLIRAVGPSLAPFGVTGVLAEPQLQLFDSSRTVRQTAAAWSGRSDADEIMAANEVAGAFALQEDSKDAAIVTTLPPGAYTVQVSGLNNTTGIAIVEVYDLP